MRTPNEISDTIGRRPDALGVKGEKRGRGKAPNPAVWQTNYWSSEFVGSDSAERIASVVALLESRRSEISEIVHSGGSAQLSDYRHGGSAGQMKRQAALSDMKIELHLSFPVVDAELDPQRVSDALETGPSDSGDRRPWP